MLVQQIHISILSATIALSTISSSVRANDNPDKGRRGFELMLRPAYGSAGPKSPIRYDPKPLVVFADPPGPGDVFSGSASPYGGGFAGDVSAGYRFLPFMSLGLYGEMRSSSSVSPCPQNCFICILCALDDGTEDLSRSGWGAGLYVRGYVPMLHDKLDPYVGVGVGYMQDTQTYKRAGLDWELKHHGIAVPLSLGVDYRLLPMLAVGPSFRYAIVSSAGGCMKISANAGALGTASNSQCADADEFRRIVKADSYGAWSVGLDIRLTLM